MCAAGDSTCEGDSCPDARRNPGPLEPALHKQHPAPAHTATRPDRVGCQERGGTASLAGFDGGGRVKGPGCLTLYPPGPFAHLGSLQPFQLLHLSRVRHVDMAAAMACKAGRALPALTSNNNLTNCVIGQAVSFASVGWQRFDKS
eukprot:scaffold200625_cov14-Tisochrysis_lutea.AAC.1